MDKKLLAVIVFVPIASVAITWLVFQSGNIKPRNINFPEQSNSEKIADTFFNHSTIINFNESGLPKSKIVGKQLFHYPGEEDSEITSPRVTFFRDQGSAVFISADQGWINQTGTRVLLKGHTTIVREKSSFNKFSKLETPELTIWPNKEYAETDKPVKITTEGTNATGVGMKAYLDKERYLLLNNVKARHIPQNIQGQ